MFSSSLRFSINVYKLLIIGIFIDYFRCKLITNYHEYGDKEDTVKTDGIAKNATHLRVMTFNLWSSGNNVESGLYKIAKHISYINADIVTLQEVNSARTLNNLVQLLGSEWSAMGRLRNFTDVAVLTRHQITSPTAKQRKGHVLLKPAEENGAFRAKIRMAWPCEKLYLDINVWSLHLDAHDYGPHALCNSRVTESSQLDSGEHNAGGSVPGRVQNIEAITADHDFAADSQTADDEPLLLMGTLNTPSHLDYTRANKEEHCGWLYRWPVTLHMEHLNFQDAYRQVHADPVKQPGFTWSPAQKFQNGFGYSIPEPQDRIDFVFYKSLILKPVKAYEYYGFEALKPIPNHYANDWPSDHASLVVDFELME